ncbi:MAG: acetyl-CoA carboxylase biotin carboxyl carrier protein subunit [Peptoniphilaceae bacterium]|nr:acetyl-CoA carboxylase biotin carboxyl carrier protein subunit [Peptoniphilaceae bacterium]MDY6085349.1 biotin/lipoyl-containing protein [Peptoniphilaceae bacterium]
MVKTYKVTVEGKTYEVTLEEVGGVAAGPVARGPQPVAQPVAPQPQAAPAPAATAAPAPHVDAPAAVGDGEDQLAPLQGNIWKVVASEGDEVAAGDTIIILEAMKMENEIVAPRDGVVTKIYVSEGQAVDAEEPLYVLK